MTVTALDAECSIDIKRCGMAAQVLRLRPDGQFRKHNRDRNRECEGAQGEQLTSETARFVVAANAEIHRIARVLCRSDMFATINKRSHCLITCARTAIDMLTKHERLQVKVENVFNKRY